MPTIQSQAASAEARGRRSDRLKRDREAVDRNAFTAGAWKRREISSREKRAKEKRFSLRGPTLPWAGHGSTALPDRVGAGGMTAGEGGGRRSGEW